MLGGIARHPNIGGYVLIGLGCETATLGYLLDDQKLVQIGGLASSPTGRPVLSMQDVGGTTKTIEAACKLVEQILPVANNVKREPFPLSELILGTNCGGSDGNSGITANPALGVASDLLVAAGGTVILGETTEIYGAEQLLTPPRRERRRGAKTGRPHSLVGMVHRPVWLHAGQQPFAGQQGRRADDHLRKVAGRDRQGRQHGHDRGLPVCRAGQGSRLCRDGHAGARPGERDRHRGRAARR